MDPYQRKSLPVASSNNDGATFRTADTRARARPPSRDTRGVAPPPRTRPCPPPREAWPKDRRRTSPRLHCLPPGVDSIGRHRRLAPETVGLRPRCVATRPRTRLVRAALAPRSLRITPAARAPLAPRSLHFKVGGFGVACVERERKMGRNRIGSGSGMAVTSRGPGCPFRPSSSELTRAAPRSHSFACSSGIRGGGSVECVERERKTERNRAVAGRAVAGRAVHGDRNPCGGARVGRVAPPPAASRAPLARAPPRTSPHTIAPPWFIQ